MGKVPIVAEIILVRFVCPGRVLNLILVRFNDRMLSPVNYY